MAADADTMDLRISDISRRISSRNNFPTIYPAAPAIGAETGQQVEPFEGIVDFGEGHRLQIYSRKSKHSKDLFHTDSIRCIEYHIMMEKPLACSIMHNYKVGFKKSFQFRVPFRIELNTAGGNFSNRIRQTCD